MVLGVRNDAIHTLQGDDRDTQARVSGFGFCSPRHKRGSFVDKLRTRRFRIDSIDAVACTFLVVGTSLLVWGLILDPPSSANEFVASQYADWTPGIIVDGLLLYTVNRIIRRSEKQRVLSQAASLSNEFALDAVRRTRAEGWLQDGSMRDQDLARARLSGADLSDAELAGSDLSFSDLSNASLRHANLRGVNLVGANLGGADLRWADLSNAQLRWADLRMAQVEGAITTHVDATFASIDEHADDHGSFANAVTDGYLSKRQIELVRSSFDLVMAAGDVAMHHFYEKLFKENPGVRPLFPENMNRQARKLLQSLRLIVSSLDQPEHAVLVLQQLGERHRGYGVKSAHYEAVGAALIETLEELLGDAFSDEVKTAWVAAYALVSSVMSYAGEGVLPR